MKRRVSLFPLILAGLMVCTPAALAQGHAASATAAAPSANPKSEALARRYLKAIHFESLMDTMMGAMLPLITDSAAKQAPNLTAADRAKLTDIVRASMREFYTPKMIERMVPIYAATFTEAELEAIVAFYESPVGQAVVAKSPSLAPKSADVARELIPELQRDVAQRICAAVSCLTAPATAPKAQAS